MERVVFNLSGKVRKASLHGREHLVAPLTMLVSGVLNGSQGALFYPQEEIEKDPSVWNNVPLVVGHPSVNGQPVSARDPDVLEKFGVGHVYRSAVANGKLTAEGWFDVGALSRTDRRILQALEAGQKIEISTGLFTKNTPAEPGAVFNGRPYSHIATDYKPDHLAILVDQIGACSISDGCGVLNANYPEKCPHCNTALEIDPDSGVCNRCGKKVEPVANALGWLDGLKRWLLLEGFTSPVENAKKKKQPSDTADVSPEKACQILKDGMVHGQPLTEAQRGMLGAICGKKPTANALGADWLCQVCNTNHNQGDQPAPVETKAMLTAEQRKGHSDFITANCDCWKGQHMEKVLNELPEDELLKVRAGVENVQKLTANAAKPALPVATPVVQPQTAEQWFATAPAEIQSVIRNAMAVEQQQKAQIVAQLVANRPAEQRQARSEQLMRLPLGELQERLSDLPQVQNANPFSPNYLGAAAPAFNAKDDGDNLLPEITYNFDDYTDGKKKSG